MEMLGPIGGFLPFILIFVLFFVLIIRPQQSREKKHKAMLNEISKGDIVVTSGGLHGRVEDTGGDEATVLKVTIAEGVRVDILRSSITYTKKGGELIEG
jgi:preprotein translocase subunit YajC